jgi:glycerate 2-kinase
MTLSEQAEHFFKSILKNVNPREFMPDILQWNGNKNRLSVYDHTFAIHDSQQLFVIGTGKASPTMAEAAEKILGERIEAGFIIAPPGSKADLNIIEMMEGSHPLPDKNSFEASKKLVSFTEQIPENSVVINLVSGGTSALFALPVDGISMEELRKVFELLLQSGASIHEVNSVRKTLSQVKGGRFLHRLKHTTLIDLVISDVPDDDLRYIGSGPTTAQEISFEKSFGVLKKYSIWDKLPEPVKHHLQTGLDREKEQNEIRATHDFEQHFSWIVSSASKVAEQTKQLIEKKGFETERITPAWSGLIEDFEGIIIQKINEFPTSETGKRALVFFGECTVKVTGDGLGGRNQELALRMAKRLKETGRNVAFLSAGTDGIDGPTDAAGAVVDQHTWQKAQENNLDPDKYISQNDSYHFFQKTGGHIITGPTGNNVMDLQIVLTDQ